MGRIPRIVVAWVILPMTTFLLGVLVTKQILRVTKVGKEARFLEQVNESKALYKKGDREAALTNLLQASEKMPNDPTYHLEVATGFESLGRREKAAGHYEKMLREMPGKQNATNFTALAEYYLDIGELENAKRILNGDLLPRWPDALESIYLQGVLKLKESNSQEDVRAALERFEKCLGLKPDHTAAKIQAGICFQRLGRSAEGETLFKSLLEKLPKHPLVLHHLGQLLSAQGKGSEAKIYLDQSKAINDLQQRQRFLELRYSRKQHISEDLLELGKIYLELESFESAASTLYLYTRVEPTNPEGHSLLAQAYSKLNREKDAEAEKKLADALRLAEVKK